MKVCKSPLPENSRIVRYPDANYRDCFRCRLQIPGKVSPNQVMAAFWTTSPAWLKILFRLRDLLVRPFGLKTGEGPSREKLEEALNNGESCGFMSVAERTADETIVALDDKHLVAYMSIYIEGGEVFASTVVKYHNKLGVVYFNLIREKPLQTNDARTRVLTRSYSRVTRKHRRPRNRMSYYSEYCYSCRRPPSEITKATIRMRC